MRQYIIVTFLKCITQDGKTCFIKVHAPWDVLSRMAEVNRMRVPLQQSDIDDNDEKSRQPGLMKRGFTKMNCGKAPFELEVSWGLTERLICGQLTD